MLCANIALVTETKPQFLQYHYQSLDSAEVPLVSLLGSTIDFCLGSFQVHK